MIKVSELAYCRMQVSDLDRAEKFLVDFGLIPVNSKSGSRFFRGSEPQPYCYVIEEGSDHFLGFAFQATSRQDLETLASAMGAPIEKIDAPGGGERVRLKEPGGYDVDVVYGIEATEPIVVERQPYNLGENRIQRKEAYRLPKGAPTPVKRLAHVVLACGNSEAAITWFTETLGLISSDNIVAGPQNNRVGAFLRVDCGEEYVDHHSLALFASPVSGLQHLSFEVPDIDAVFADHEYLKSKGEYEHMWGMGRHLLGSQVFDYWSDPFGYTHEHWADSDRFNSSAPAGEWNIQEGLVNQWGEPSPEKFRVAVKP